MIKYKYEDTKEAIHQRKRDNTIEKEKVQQDKQQFTQKTKD
jgi:hypothetical protein